MVKAEKAALIDRHIEQELLKNLQTGKYKDIWNVDQKNWEKVLEKQAVQQENEEEFDSEDIDNVFVSDLYNDKEPRKGKNEEDEDGQSQPDYSDDEGDEKVSSNTPKTNNTSNLSDKKFMSKKRNRIDKNKKGKFNMEYEYENKEKDFEQNYNDW